MVNRRKQTLLVVSGVLILAIALGVSAVFAQVESQPTAQVQAQPAAQPVLQDGDDAPDEPEAGDPADEDKALPGAPFAGHGGAGRRGGVGRQLEGLTPVEELLAESLGVTVEELQEAHALVREALIEEGAGRGRRGATDNDEINALLAEALSETSGKEITVEALEAAHEEAREVLQEEFAEAYPEQAALKEAHEALKEAIDREAVMAEAAEAVGLDPAALQEAMQNRGSLFALLEEAGVTIEDFAAAQQEAHDNAVQNAVPEYLSQEQADLILESDLAGTHGLSGPRGGHHGRGNCPGGGEFGGRGGQGGPGGGFGGRGGPGGGNAPIRGASL